MTVDPSVVPGLLFLLAELAALAAVGYVIVRVGLRETDHRVALAQGLIVGPAIWGVIVNLIMYALPGMAGAVAGWIVVLALAAALVWRSRKPVRPSLRVVAWFALAALALLWIALASRQTLGINDAALRLGLPTSIRAGLFPPELPWNPGAPAPYHYGVSMVNGLLAPPSGPDPAFVMELLSAYGWIALALVVVTALLRRYFLFAVIAVAPLLLTDGASTLVFDEPAGIVQAPIPAGIPSAGIRASLTEIYRPAIDMPRNLAEKAPPNIGNHWFTLSYALAFVVLYHAARADRRSWPMVVTLAALIGFLGLMTSTLAPIVFALWIGLEIVRLIQSKPPGTSRWSEIVPAVSGVALATMLLLSRSFAAAILGGSVTSGLSLGGNEYVELPRMFGTLEQLPGGIALLRLGPLAIAGAAVLLAWRDRLVQVLAVGTSLLLIAALILNYEPQPLDIVRFEGHARNFALLALLLALSVRLTSLRSVRWRYTAGAAIGAVIVWSTIAQPVRNVGLAIGNGVELANAQPGQHAPGTRLDERFVLKDLPSDRVTAYIRKHTASDTRVFSPNPRSMTYATGRPNAVGFAELVHLSEAQGPEYRDVLHYLETTAVRRLDFEYIHAPDKWVELLPAAATSRLNDPRLFKLLVRDDSESLYRVLPAFLSIDQTPAPGSFEALRRAVPASAIVYLLPYTDHGYRKRGMFRTASALSHAELRGVIDQTTVNLQTSWRAEPLGDDVPDIVVAPRNFTPWMFPAALRQPIWWNNETAVYALNGAVDPIMPPPPWAEPLPLSVRVSDVSELEGRIAFAATFDQLASQIPWSGQDWVLIATQPPPWHLPVEIVGKSYTLETARWFTGHLWPGSGTTTRAAYEFDFYGNGLSARREDGSLEPVQSSELATISDSYVLAIRVRHEFQPRVWRVVAYLPVLRITLSETGEVSYNVHEDVAGS